jgi:hypothetical protein
MDLVLVSALLVLGVIMVLFTKRIAVLVNKTSLSIFKIAPWLNFSGKREDILLDDWKKSRLHIFESIWIWGIRVIGVIFVIGSILVVIYALINQT